MSCGIKKMNKHYIKTGKPIIVGKNKKHKLSVLKGYKGAEKTAFNK